MRRLFASRPAARVMAARAAGMARGGDSPRRRWLAYRDRALLIGGALVLAGSSAFAAAPAGAAASVAQADPQVAALLAALRADAGPTGLASALSRGPVTAANWRARLAPVFARSARFTGYAQAPRRLRGDVLAGTLRLPATIDLAGDVTVVARHLQLAGRTLTIHAHGHAIRFYPINSVTVDVAAAGISTAAVMTTSSPVVVSANGQPGAAGSAGQAGNAGEAGSDGAPGEDGFGFCDAGDGENGGDGLNGTSGLPGGFGAPGGAAGDISFSIPPGSTSTYFFQAIGGQGGDGGQGGNGGNGGQGGAGGNGGLPGDWWCVPGNGGNGGNGGAGGSGVDGSSGGNGGAGGNISVTYPPGFDPANISFEVLGGAVGRGGRAGLGGAPGAGGSGGSGHSDFDPGGVDGVNGNPGSPGFDGVAGADGALGPNGTVTVSPSG